MPTSNIVDGPDYADISFAVEDEENLTFVLEDEDPLTILPDSSIPLEGDDWKLSGYYEKEGHKGHVEVVYNPKTRSGSVRWG